MKYPKPKWLLKSRAYKKARDLVAATIRSPEKLMQLVSKAQIKAIGKDKLASLVEPITAAFRLLKAYAKGEYKDISFESLALIVASMIYFVMPVDVIPDFIVGLGFTDDAALLAWTFKSVAADIERFLKWEKDEYDFVEGEVSDNDESSQH